MMLTTIALVLVLCFVIMTMYMGPMPPAVPAAPGQVPPQPVPAPISIQQFQLTTGRVVPKRKDATNNAILANGSHDTLKLKAETNYCYEIMDICVIPDLVPDGQIAPTSHLDLMDLTIGDFLAIKGSVNNIGQNSFPFPTVTAIQKPLLQRMREIAMQRMLTHPPDPNGVRDGRNLLQAARYWIDEGEEAICKFYASATAVANSYYVMLKYREYLQTGLEKQAKFMPGGSASQMRFFYSMGTNAAAGTLSKTNNKIDKALASTRFPFPFEDACEDSKWYEVWGAAVAPQLHQEETRFNIAGEQVGGDVNVGFLTNPQINELPFGDDDDRLVVQGFEEPIIIVPGQSLKTFFENDATLAVVLDTIKMAFFGVEHLMSL